MMVTTAGDLQSSLFWEIWKNSPDNMFILRVGEDDFYIVDTNQAQQDTVAVLRNASDSQPLREIIPSDFYEFVTPNYRRCVSERKPIQYEEAERFTSEDGQPNYWSTLLLPVLDERKAVAFIFGISRNITELKRTQARFEKAAEEAERANQVKTAFLANMSHEMRTPLNGIQVSAELLNDMAASGEQQELCEIISRSAESLTRLTGDILEFAKIDAGELRLDHHDFSLHQLCNDIHQLLGPVADEKCIEFAITPEAGLPDSLVGDSGRLRQVLLNLAGNAIKFTDQGSVTIDIRTKEKQANRIILEFAVSDTGIGISPDDLERLFKPFSQVDESTTRHYDGSGLGLAISKNLVERMGGDIGVNSLQGDGSCFTVQLPFDYRVLQAPKTVETAQHSDISLKGLRVLLVEDNVINQMVVEKILAQRGVDVTLAHDGRQAVDFYQQGDFDLILMDWHMPLMDGLDATRFIRRLPGNKSRVPILGLTASVMAEHRSACLKAGMDEVIAKPVKRQHLYDRMIEQLQRYGQES